MIIFTPVLYLFFFTTVSPPAAFPDSFALLTSTPTKRAASASL
jgi:hypothetical protein